MSVLTTGAAPGIARRSAKWLRGGLLLAALGLLLVPPSPAQTTSREYQIKAVFLFNFAQFVEWPPDAFPDAQAPLIIGVLGEDPFGSVLDDTVRGEKIGSHSLLVQRYKRPEDIAACHILFLSQSESSRLEAIVALLRGRSLLTVSDTAGAARRGVMVGFATENKRIRLQINLEAARAADLVLSSKLLRPADIVAGQPEAP